MDELVQKQLVRQLKWLNFLVTFFGILFLSVLIVVGFFLYKTADYVHKSEQSISNLQQKTSQTLNTQQLCQNSSIRSIIGRYCQ